MSTVHPITDFETEGMGDVLCPNKDCAIKFSLDQKLTSSKYVICPECSTEFYLNNQSRSSAESTEFCKLCLKSYMVTGNVNTIAMMIAARLKYLSGSASKVQKKVNFSSVVNVRNSGASFVVQLPMYSTMTNVVQQDMIT